MPASRFAAWTCLLAVAGLWETRCGYTRYDLRRSASGCTRLKGGGAACVEPRLACVGAEAASGGAPRWLGSLGGSGGPLLTWAPVLMLSTGGRARRALVVAAALVWYLAFIGAVRHTHRLLHTRWDPSGHVFVYAAQLGVIWHLSERELLPRGRSGHVDALLTGWLAAWPCALWYLSAATASLFHTLSETSAGWALAALLVCALRAHESPGLPARCTLGAALSWCVWTGYGWCVAGAGERAVMGGQLAYDCVLWALLLTLSGRPAPCDGGEGEQASLAAGDSAREAPKK